MVKKLLKYDFIHYSRTMLPMQIVLIAIAIVTRIIQFFENDSTPFAIVNTSAIVILVIAMIVLLVMTVAVSISRFYKNLFTNEGYLSFTLPVSATQHIFSKLIVALFGAIISVASIIISICIATAGEVCAELFKALGYFANIYFNSLKADGVFYIIEAVVLLIMAQIASFLLFYTCIAIGQLSKKNRVLTAFGVYFGYYMITQVFGTVMIIFGTWFVDTTLFKDIIEWIDKYPYEFLHILICAGILFYLILSVIYFFVTRYIMTRKLNIE